MVYKLSPEAVKMILSAAAIFIVYFFAIITNAVINRRIKDLKIKYHARKTTLYMATLVSLACLGLIWIQTPRSVAVVASVIGAGLVLALTEVILCISGWFIIVFKKPFDTGDRVEINGVKGDVIDIRLFQTSLLEIGNWVGEEQSTGRIVHVSNNSIFRGPTFNYTRGFEYIWDELKVIVTFESNWKKAKEIMIKYGTTEIDVIQKRMEQSIKRMARSFLIYYDKLTPIVYVKIMNNGVELSLRYLTEAQKRRGVKDSLCQSILDEFEKEKDINFAYPTYRLVKS